MRAAGPAAGGQAHGLPYVSFFDLCTGPKVLLDSIFGSTVQPDWIPLVTVLPESWYFNCSSAGTAHGILVRSRAYTTVTSTDPVFILRTRFLPLCHDLSALREVSPPGAPLALCC